MSRLFPNFSVDIGVISSFLSENWNLRLGGLLKASQNHTFLATNESDTKFAVRITPVSNGNEFERIHTEMQFVHYLHRSGLSGVCFPIMSNTGHLVMQTQLFIVCVSSWAEGSPIDFTKYFWLTNPEIIKAQGRWLGSLHDTSIRFTQAHREISQRMRKWNQVHDDVMAQVTLNEQDSSVLESADISLADSDMDPSPLQRVGILHGDLNVSNFFLIETNENPDPTTSTFKLSVFDWDQVHWGWFELDLAQSILTSLMLSEAGSVILEEPVAGADPTLFTALIVEGYEEIRGSNSVDRERLDRLIQLRKLFYARFCQRATEEGKIPPEMAGFISYINKWVQKSPPVYQ